MLSGGCLVWRPGELSRAFGTPSTLAAAVASIFVQSGEPAGGGPVPLHASSIAAAIPYRDMGLTRAERFGVIERGSMKDEGSYSPNTSPQGYPHGWRNSAALRCDAARLLSCIALRPGTRQYRRSPPRRVRAGYQPPAGAARAERPGVIQRQRLR